MEENLDQNAVRDIEQILDTKIYPGTEVMKDVGNHRFVKGGGNNSSSVLVPQPSDDPHDPLNWSPKWKAITLFCATLSSLSLNLGPLSSAPLFGDLVQEWHHSLADTIQFTGVAILVLGFSNFVWVPISVCYGRRPVMILSSLICACASIWRARATSYDSFMGSSVLNGFAAGPCETLMPQIIADCIFLHDRGKYNTLYFATYFAALMVGPIIAGAMAFHTGWRSFMWLNAALLFITFFLSIFIFPETRYRREYETSNNKIDAVKPSNGGGVPSDEKESHPLERSATSSSPHPVPTATITPAAPPPQDPWLGRGHPSKSQFALWQPYEGSILREIYLPFYLHLNPIVELASFIVSFSASGYLICNLTQTQAFAAPPYNYDSQTIGLFNVAILVGGIIGLITNGPFSDWVAAYLTRRNNGVREPEMRLLAMIPYVFIMIIGFVITGVGYDAHWNWPTIVVVGYGCLGIQVSALPAIASTYAVDSYKPVTGSIFVAITVNKNLWGYGLSRFLPVWAEEVGFVPGFMTTMALVTLFCLCAIPFWFYGKRIRGWTKDSFIHKL